MIGYVFTLCLNMCMTMFPVYFLHHGLFSDLPDRPTLPLSKYCHNWKHYCECSSMFAFYVHINTHKTQKHTLVVLVIVIPYPNLPNSNNKHLSGLTKPSPPLWNESDTSLTHGGGCLAKTQHKRVPSGLFTIVIALAQTWLLMLEILQSANCGDLITKTKTK